jgi:hypothetical protein
LLTLDVVHLVSTYAGGVERFYVNGVQHPSVLDVTKDVIVGFATRKTPIAQTAYSFFYFFPVALFLSILLAQRRNGRGTSLLLAALIGAGMATVTEFFQAFAFERTVDFPLIGYSLIVSTVGALTGAGLQVEVNQQREAGCLSEQA